jgi:hypothetical protein
VRDFKVDHRRQRSEDPGEILGRVVEELRVEKVTGGGDS